MLGKLSAKRFMSRSKSLSETIKKLLQNSEEVKEPNTKLKWPN